MTVIYVVDASVLLKQREFGGSKITDALIGSPETELIAIPATCVAEYLYIAREKDSSSMEADLTAPLYHPLISIESVTELDAIFAADFHHASQKNPSEGANKEEHTLSLADSIAFGLAHRLAHDLNPATDSFEGYLPSSENSPAKKNVTLISHDQWWADVSAIRSLSPLAFKVQTS